MTVSRLDTSKNNDDVTGWSVVITAHGASIEPIRGGRSDVHRMTIPGGETFTTYTLPPHKANDA